MKQGIRVGSFFLILLAAGCGKKGPPLPPLVSIPSAPADFTAVRRGATVTIRFVAPSANTDGSTPADLERIDVYALTGPPTVTADEIIKRGAKVGSVSVNPPADPDAPADESARSDATVPRDGVDQGASRVLTDSLTENANADLDEIRSYLAVGFSKRGRRGAFSTRALVPMGPAPATPAQPRVEWDETTITVTWPPLAAAAPEFPVVYHLYAVEDGETRLTERPVEDTPFADHRIEWGSRRCYIVRAVTTRDALSLESEASPTTCVTLVDTFPPAAPVGLTVVAAAGAINLIWERNSEADLAGYLVLRAIAPESTPVPVNPTPLDAPTFKDTVPAGASVMYAVQAVDKAGNISPMSARVEEIAR